MSDKPNVGPYEFLCYCAILNSCAIAQVWFASLSVVK